MVVVEKMVGRVRGRVARRGIIQTFVMWLLTTKVISTGSLPPFLCQKCEEVRVTIWTWFAGLISSAVKFRCITSVSFRGCMCVTHLCDILGQVCRGLADPSPVQKCNLPFCLTLWSAVTCFMSKLTALYEEFILYFFSFTFIFAPQGVTYKNEECFFFLYVTTSTVWLLLLVYLCR